MISVLSIFLLILISGIVYLCIAVLKNWVSRLNLKYVLKIKFGNYDNHKKIGRKKKQIKNLINYSYIRRDISRAPDIVFLNICAGTFRTSAEFLIIREGWFDKLFKYLGVSSELQTGVNWFDRRYYIVSEHNDSIQQLLCNENICKSIDALLIEGFDYLMYHDGALKTSYSTFTGWRWFKSGVIERSTNQMTILRDLIESELFPNSNPLNRQYVYCSECEGYLQHYINIPKTALKKHPKKWARQREIWLSSGVFVSLFGLTALIIHLIFQPYPVTEMEKVVDYGLIYIALPIMIMHLSAAGFHLKGRSRSHKELAWIALLCGFGYSFIAALLLQIANGVFDSSQVETRHTVLVDTKYFNSSKGPDEYSIIVNSWRNTGTEKLGVKESFYETARNKINKPITIYTQRGAFNIERLVDYCFDN